MLSWLFSRINEFLGYALFFLPSSPFESYINAVSSIPFLGWLNWFVPVAQIIAIGQAWLVAIGLFYTVQAILRWIKVVQS